MKTYNWEGVNPDVYFLDKLEPIPSSLPSFQKLFHVSSFFFNDPATTEIYTLSLHDALPIYRTLPPRRRHHYVANRPPLVHLDRSEEHTSELQSPVHLVCRLLLEKKKRI